MEFPAIGTVLVVTDHLSDGQTAVLSEVGSVARDVDECEGYAFRVKVATLNGSTFAASESFTGRPIWFSGEMQVMPLVEG